MFDQSPPITSVVTGRKRGGNSTFEGKGAWWGKGSKKREEEEEEEEEEETRT
jgi:hypothetical protein